MGDYSYYQYGALDSACDYSVGQLMSHSEPAPKYRRTMPERAKRKEPKCVKCDQSRAPIRTPDLDNGFSAICFWWSCIMTGLVFGLGFRIIVELVS